MSGNNSKGLIFLDSKNPIIYDQLKSRILDGKRENCEISFSDFDDISFKIKSAVESPNIIKIDLAVRTAAALRRFGADTVLDRVYPGMKTTPDLGFDFAVQFDCSSVPEPLKFLNDISELKRNVCSAPLDKAFIALTEGKLSELELMSIPYRKSESMYVCPGSAKVVVIYSIDFADSTDKAFAKVFLQEFVESQRAVRTAPPVSYSREPPLELASLNIGAKEYQDSAGFISFSVEQRHVEGSRREVAITLLSGFRAYLHYHIKCSKTYLHARMRKKVDGWMQVLHRAMPEVEQEKKTAAGKTFTRK